MKIRNLEAQYDNLHPYHVFYYNHEEPIPTVKELEIKYTKLWEYARRLEIDVRRKNHTINKLKHEVRKVNQAIYRKHQRIVAIKAFGKAFADFTHISRAFK